MDPKLYYLLLDTFRGELFDQHNKMIDLLISFEKIKTKSQREQALQELFRISHNIKGSAKSVSLDELANQAHKLEDIFAGFKQSTKKPKKSEIDDILSMADSLIIIFKKFMVGLNKVEDEVLQVPLSRVERINAKLGELGVFQLRLTSMSKDLVNIYLKLSKLVNIGSVNSSKYIDELMHMESSLDKLNKEFARDLHVLQQESRMMRLLPVSSLLTPFKRVIRDEADKLGKQVELKISGGNVEIDKYILDGLNAPLQHIIRNSIAHGIEDPETRKKIGKTESGLISIDVESMAGEVKFVCQDDGQGLDIEKIRQQAIANGLCTPEEFAQLSTDKIYEIVFNSGFSTASEVSELSGRGVGLDAVLEDVQRVRGQVLLESEKDRGCRFILKVPITMATSRGLFVKSKDKTFMLPTISLQGLYDIEIDTLERVDNRWVSIIHGKPVVVYDLLELLMDGRNTFTTGARLQGVLIGGMNRQIIVLVDQIVNEHDCVIKPLPHPLDKLKSILGATLTEETELVMVVNVREILEFSADCNSFSLNSRSDSVSDGEKVLPNILIVDDAITTRSLTMNAFSAAGYNPICAENGQKALDIIRNNRIDCVVTDVEMPVIGGIELIQIMRKDEAFANVPVVIVTAHDNKNYQKQGMDAGANAFLVKKSLETSSLINKVESLL